MAYKIKETREFYGPRKENFYLSDYFGNPETFKSKKAAQDRIAELDSATYRLAHNESSRPSYKVVKA